MRIAYMTETYHPDVNGIVTYFDTSVRYLQQKGYEVLICAPSVSDDIDVNVNVDEQLHKKGFQIARFPALSLDRFIDVHNKRMTLPFYGNIPKKVKRALDQFRPDVIHIQTELWLSFAGLKWARRNNVPTIITIHTQMLTCWEHYIPWLPKSILKPLLTYFFKPMYNAVDFLIAPTEGMRKYLAENHDVHRSFESYIIGVDPCAFIPADSTLERQNSAYFVKYPRIKKRCRLLFAGRITTEKNIEFLFEALQVLLKQRVDVELMLAGYSRVIRVYQKKAEEMGISDNVTFLGPVPHCEMSKLYAITDIFTFASKAETQGLATTEAIYFGVPAVVVSAQGSDTVLAGNKGGYLVKEDKFIFASTINSLLSDPGLYSKKKQEALARQHELSFSNTVKNLTRIYEEVTTKRHSIPTIKNPLMFKNFEQKSESLKPVLLKL